MVDTTHLAQVIIGVLNSEPAQKINFTLGLMKVDGPGLRGVATLVQTGSWGGPGVKIGFNVPAGYQASYDEARNTLNFPRANYGTTPFERACILHECVHAMHDVFGGKRIVSEYGSGFATRADNEAAAWVADALFSLYDTGQRYATGPIEDVAFAIAEGLRASRGTNVSLADAHAMRTAIMNHPDYSHVTPGMVTTADG